MGNQNSTPTNLRTLSASFLFAHYSALAADCKRLGYCEASVHFAFQAEKYRPAMFTWAAHRALTMYGPAFLASGNRELRWERHVKMAVL